MVLGKLLVPGRPTIWITVGQGSTAFAVGAGGVCLDIFTLIYPFSPVSPSLWETARYRMKNCLKGPLNPKSTNQPTHDKRKKYLYRIKSEVTNLRNPGRDISFPIFIRKEIETRKLELKSKQKISRLIDLLCRLNDIIGC